MFGAGYATAEDRLFFIDALRHAGRAQLSSFAGGANAAMDESVWADTPYNEADLQEQYDRAPPSTGSGASRSSRTSRTTSPASTSSSPRPASNPTQAARRVRPDRPTQSICLPGHQWKVDDVISIASLVAGIFGKGGGGELGNSPIARRRRRSASARPGQEGLGRTS